MKGPITGYNGGINIGSKVVFRINGEKFKLIYDFLDGRQVNEVVTPKSPAGRAIFDKKDGDIFEAFIRGRKVLFEILEVE